jgi:hypothetical protein
LKPIFLSDIMITNEVNRGNGLSVIGGKRRGKSGASPARSRHCEWGERPLLGCISLFGYGKTFFRRIDFCPENRSHWKKVSRKRIEQLTGKAPSHCRPRAMGRRGPTRNHEPGDLPFPSTCVLLRGKGETRAARFQQKTVVFACTSPPLCLALSTGFSHVIK